MLETDPAAIRQGSTAAEDAMNEAVSLSSAAAGRILAAMAGPQAVPEGRTVQLLGAPPGMTNAGIHPYVSASSPQLKSNAAPSRSPVLSPAPTAPGSPAASAGSSRYIGPSGFGSREGSDIFRNSTPTSRQPRYQILRRRTSPPRTVKDFSELTGHFTGGSSVSSPIPSARSPRGHSDVFKASSNAGSPPVLMRTLDGRTYPVAPGSSPALQRDLPVGQVSRYSSVPDSAEMQRMQARIEELEGELERRLAEVAEQENRISVLTRRNEELEGQYKLIQTEELEERMEWKKTFQEAELSEPLPAVVQRRESTPGAMAAAAVAAIASASLGLGSFAKPAAGMGNPSSNQAVGSSLSGTQPQHEDQIPLPGGPSAANTEERDDVAPILQEAERALNTLHTPLISEIKAFKNPPASVRMVLSAVCVLRGIKPARVKDDKGRMADDYWPSAVKMMSEKGFLQSLLYFDKDHIPSAVMQKVSAFTSREDFRSDVVSRSSVAAAGLCQWVRAVEAYDKILKSMPPPQEEQPQESRLSQSRGSADDGPLRRIERVPSGVPADPSKEPSAHDSKQPGHSQDEYSEATRPAANDAGDGEEYSYVEEEYTEDYAELHASQGGLKPQAAVGSIPAGQGGALRRPATSTAPQRPPSASAQLPRKAASVGPRTGRRQGGAAAESAPARSALRAKAMASPVDGAAAVEEAVEGDEIDSALRKNMQAIAPVYRNVELSKIRKNWYQFGPPVDKKVFIKQVARDKVAVRVGTTFLPLDKFIADNRTR
mmetsp:Transcript_42836/g.98215  ORF Transcript_42836/g.98215 Transcript_42836/m.98215 type:complete len:770 (-) Transcript_42836:165-2474(-)